jgi:4'-phosphopantetheinyl transferase
MAALSIKQRRRPFVRARVRQDGSGSNGPSAREVRVREVVTLAASSTEAMSSDELDEASQRLPESEQQRASNIRLDRPRKAFVLGRLLLRSTVARVAGVPADDVGIELEPTGRPGLTGELSRYFVSIAHGGCHVLVGVATRQIGVDVEKLRQSAPSPQLMARVCSPDELHLLGGMTDADRAAAFMTVWARKEAYGKAIGRGLDFALRSVTVGLAGSIISGSAGDWRVADVDVDPGCAAAVVAEGSDWRVQFDRVQRRTP